MFENFCNKIQTPSPSNKRNSHNSKIPKMVLASQPKDHWEEYAIQITRSHPYFLPDKNHSCYRIYLYEILVSLLHIYISKIICRRLPKRPILEIHPFFFFFFFFLVFLGPDLWHMEVPRLGVELEPQPQGIWSRLWSIPQLMATRDL